MTNSHRMGGKLDSVHLGPYTIIEVADKGRYRLQNGNGKVLKKYYNGVLLKEYFSPTKSQESPNVKQSPAEPPRSTVQKVYNVTTLTNYLVYIIIYI